MDTVPTIKGIFVKSHIRSVEQMKGRAGLNALEHCYGQPLIFQNNDNIPVTVEAKIIDCALAILTDHGVNPAIHDIEAGRLHFRNFLTTPLAKIIFSALRKQLKPVLLRAGTIASHIWRGMSFSSLDLGPTTVKITAENVDYPLDHFRGLLLEWMKFAGVEGEVEARDAAGRRFEYIVHWT